MNHGEKAAALLFFVIGFFLGGLGGLTLGHDLTMKDIMENANETPEGPQQMGHISWKEITRGVQQALLQEKFLIALAEMDKEMIDNE